MRNRIKSMFQCITAAPPEKHTPLDDLYDRVQAKHKAYKDLVAECEAALKDAWAISVRANLMGNKNICLKEPLMADIMGERVRIQIDTSPTFLTSPRQRHDFLWASIRELLADTWGSKRDGKGSSELAPHGFTFVDSPMTVTVDGYIFELVLRIHEGGPYYTPAEMIDQNVKGEHRDSTRGKLSSLWVVIAKCLGNGNSKYDCATIVIGGGVRFNRYMSVSVGGEWKSTLELVKLRTPC